MSSRNRAMVIALLLLGAAGSAAASDQILRVTVEQRRQLGIRTAQAAPAIAGPIASLPATVVPPPGARVAVSAPFAGVIRQSFAVAGQTVARGEALATVFSREVLEMGAELSRARARSGVARSAAARAELLVSEGIAAGARSEEARAALREAEVDVSARARLLALANANPATGIYTLRAPIAGRISAGNIQIGGAIDGLAAPFVIDSARRYAIEAQLPVRLVGVVRAGDRIVLPGGAIGTVTSVGVTIDPQTRSAVLKASVPAAPGLIAGQAITVELLGSGVAGAVTVPATAIVRMAGRTMVFLDGPGGFRVVPVSRVSGSSATAVITGVPAGARVAVTGVSELKAMGLNAPAGN